MQLVIKHLPLGRARHSVRAGVQRTARPTHELVKDWLDERDRQRHLAQIDWCVNFALGVVCVVLGWMTYLLFTR